MLHLRQENLPASDDGTALFSSPAALDKLLKYLFEIVFIFANNYSTIRKNCHTLRAINCRVFQHCRKKKDRFGNEANIVIKDFPMYSAGGYNYLQVGKPSLNIPLDAHMVQPEYVSSVQFIMCHAWDPQEA